MKSGITLEQALAKARPGLRYRIEESVATLRKGERLALRYNSEDGYYLAFSGGKDSQALYHIAELAGVKFKAHFSPTTVDPPQLIRFIRRQYPEVEFGKVEMSMYQAAKNMGMVPTMKLRWCCAKFKESAGGGKSHLRESVTPRVSSGRNESSWRCPATSSPATWTSSTSGARGG